MINLRLFLQSQGLSGADIDLAVRQARNVAHQANVASSVVKQLLLNATEKTNSEILKKWLNAGAAVASNIYEGTDSMLSKSKKPLSAPSNPIVTQVISSKKG